jgi:hypothetical protein
MTSSRSLVAVSPLAFGTLITLFLDPGLSELKNFAPTILLCGLIIWCVVKLAPTWKEVKMRELDIREKEVAQREQQAIAIQSLAEVTRDIAVEQKHATEALRIAERVNIREGEKLGEAVREITGRVDAIDAKFAEARA